ncbi:hypothetical protein A2U01_0010230 [Trifolium medium]|uniref:Uncharacterized protein n=1 Tax=Trifolium medium TaxID=97028 RepID=A0A392MQF9_9FABA|nr:hypothetical protein [Trifolium medium]
MSRDPMTPYLSPICWFFSSELCPSVCSLVSCCSFVDLGGEWDFHCMGEVMPNSDYGA